MLKSLLQKFYRNWFLWGLIIVAVLTILDTTQTISAAGRWVKAQNGPELAIFLIFLLSGLQLDIVQIQSGLKDGTGVLAALVNLFIMAPLIAAVMSQMPLSAGIMIGFFLVASMPSTLSSGVVMTAAAGRNMAHALLITIIANTLAVITIPICLDVLLPLIGNTAVVTIAKGPIVLKLAGLVLFPLCIGLVLKRTVGHLLGGARVNLNIVNQGLILIIVWMAASQSQLTIMTSSQSLLLMAVLVFAFHAVLLVTAMLLTGLLGIGPGRRESVIFMGAQKTLPLSIVIQVSLFSQYGEALAVCVVHHIVHLLMDGYLVGKLRK